MVLLSGNLFAIMFWLVLAFGGPNVALSKSLCSGELNSVFKVICAEFPTINDDNRNVMGHVTSGLDESSNRFKQIPDRGIVERNRRQSDYSMRTKHECCERPCNFTELKSYCEEVDPDLGSLSISKQLCGTELTSVFSVICVTFPSMENRKRNVIGHFRQIPNKLFWDTVWNGPSNSEERTMDSTVGNNWFNQMDGERSGPDGSRFKDLSERAIVIRNQRRDESMRNKHLCCERPCNMTELLSYCDEVATQLEGLSVSKRLCGTELTSVFSVICVTFPNMHNGKRNSVGHARQIFNNPFPKTIWNGQYYREEADVVPDATVPRSSVDQFGPLFHGSPVEP